MRCANGEGLSKVKEVVPAAETTGLSDAFIVVFVIKRLFALQHLTNPLYMQLTRWPQRRTRYHLVLAIAADSPFNLQFCILRNEVSKAAKAAALQFLPVAAVSSIPLLGAI